MDDITEWRATEYPGYFVNGVGQVRGVRGWILSPRPNRMGGHLSVLVTGGRPRYVHYLVCVAFHGPRPTPTHEVAHWNGDPTDNRESNLRWATRSENSADSARHGTRHLTPQRGERNGCARLTLSDVREIRGSAASGVSTRVLAQRFGVSRNQINRIVARKQWTDA